MADNANAGIDSAKRDLLMFFLMRRNWDLNMRPNQHPRSHGVKSDPFRSPGTVIGLVGCSFWQTDVLPSAPASTASYQSAMSSSEPAIWRFHRSILTRGQNNHHMVGATDNICRSIKIGPWGPWVGIKTFLSKDTWRKETWGEFTHQTTCKVKDRRQYQELKKRKICSKHRKKDRSDQ